jgi:hypothetical protein
MEHGPIYTPISARGKHAELRRQRLGHTFVVGLMALTTSFVLGLVTLFELSPLGVLFSAVYSGVASVIAMAAFYLGTRPWGGQRRVFPLVVTRCATCGFDLRGTPTRDAFACDHAGPRATGGVLICPECGEPTLTLAPHGRGDNVADAASTNGPPASARPSTLTDHERAG